MSTERDDLEKLFMRLDELHGDMLFGDEHTEAAVDKGLPPEAEQIYLLAIGAVEQAMRFMRLATLTAKRGQ